MIAKNALMPNAGTNGGHAVEVESSFDNWATRHPLQHSGKDFTLVKLLPPGVYQVSKQAVNKFAAAVLCVQDIACSHALYIRCRLACICRRGAQ